MNLGRIIYSYMFVQVKKSMGPLGGERLHVREGLLSMEGNMEGGGDEGGQGHSVEYRAYVLLVAFNSLHLRGLR